MPAQGDAARLSTIDTKTLETFEPLAFAVFHAAVNSMKPSETIVNFRIEKDVLLHKYRQGLELGLERADFLTTSSIEVLQAFVLLLVSLATNFVLIFSV